jgi:hypothetical protein
MSLLAVSNQPLQMTMTTFVTSSPGCKRQMRGPGPFVLFTELDPTHLALINDYAQVFLLFLCSPAVFFCLPGLPQEFFLNFILPTPTIAYYSITIGYNNYPK